MAQLLALVLLGCYLPLQTPMSSLTCTALCFYVDNAAPPFVASEAFSNNMTSIFCQGQVVSQLLAQLLMGCFCCCEPSCALLSQKLWASMTRKLHHAFLQQRHSCSNITALQDLVKGKLHFSCLPSCYCSLLKSFVRNCVSNFGVAPLMRLHNLAFLYRDIMSTRYLDFKPLAWAMLYLLLVQLLLGLLLAAAEFAVQHGLQSSVLLLRQDCQSGLICSRAEACTDGHRNL